MVSLDSTSGPASSTSPSADPDGQRPQLRVDSSEEDRIRLNNIWTSCLRDQGVPTYQKGKWLFPGNDKDDFKAEFKTCQSKQPRQPASEDPARNPHYAKDNRNWIKCINRDSPVIKIRETPDGWTYVKDYGANDAREAAFERTVRACELEAFGPG